jgi:hypothetical protein
MPEALAGLDGTALMQISTMMAQLVSMAEGMRQDMVGKGWSETLSEQLSGNFLLLLMSKAFA